MKIINGCLLLLLFGSFSTVAQECLDTLPQLDEDRFSILEQGVLYDSDTGLMWFRCTYGESWVNEECSGTPDLLTLDQALDIAEDTVYAGYPDWKVPNVNELQSIVDLSCYQPAVDKALFPGISSDYYLTSSVFYDGEYYDSASPPELLPMNVNFLDGQVMGMTEDFGYLIMVRQEGE